MDLPKILISHPGRQHSHHTALAFYEGGMLGRYYTSLWYKNGKSPYPALDFFFAATASKFKDQCPQAIDQDLVSQIPAYELTRQGVQVFSRKFQDRLIRWRNTHFDHAVSKKLTKESFDILLGYETSSLHAFERAKSLGKMTVLDLPIAHYAYQEKINEALGHEEAAFEKSFRRQVNEVKRKELCLADGILVGSQFVKDTLVQAGIPETRIFKVPYGFEPESFQSKVDYRKKGKFKILFVGTLAKRKGVEFLLQAFNDLKLPDAELTMVGAVGDAKDLLKKYRGSFLQLPYTRHETLKEYYQNADIFIFPSLLEGFAQSVLEAMASGTPVIVTPNTGFGDIVRNHSEGFVIPMMDVAEIKGKILFLYENREKVEEMGRNARRRIESYTWKKYGDCLRETLMLIMKQQKEKPGRIFKP